MRLARLLERHDCAALKELFHAFFASIPYARIRFGTVAGARVRGQVPGRWRADPPDRRGVQPRDAQRDGVRGGGRLRADAPSREPIFADRPAEVVRTLIITQNGEAKVVMQSIDVALLKILALGSRQIEAGRVQPAADVVAQLRERRAGR